MNVIKLVIVSLSLVFLAACSGGGGLLSKSKGDPRSVDVAGLGGLAVSSWTVSVPPTLSVSEENSIKPRADVVWHGDPAGPRHQQVAAIFEAALARVAGQSTGAQTVALQVEVIQFHALTPKLRYFAEGQHEIRFGLAATDAETGATIVPRYVVDATFTGFGGDKAVLAEAKGVSQKLRIIEQLVMRITQELTGAPVGNISGEIADFVPLVKAAQS